MPQPTKLAIIGANEFQNRLILRAKQLGIQTHVFAWESGDVGEQSADFFYPISIVEIDQIAETCRNIGVDGVCSIASDLANITVSGVADQLGLIANPPDVVKRSTDKHLMRQAFEAGGDPSPRSMLVQDVSEAPQVLAAGFRFPLIVKPTDRSGSRGITKIADASELEGALEAAFSESFVHCAVVEEYAEGEEFSVEFCSWEGNHTFLALTKKFTTGAPHFIETGHLEPAQVSESTLEAVQRVVSHALDTLGVEYGASHSEIKIDDDGTIRIIEIGSRMGGDCIGSDLVRLSTGIDFTEAVINIALGEKPDLSPTGPAGVSAVRFIFDEADLSVLAEQRAYAPQTIVYESSVSSLDDTVTDSSSRHGFWLMRAETLAELAPYLPVEYPICG